MEYCTPVICMLPSKQIREAPVIHNVAILDAACHFFKVSEADLFSRTRERRVLWPRHITMYIMNMHTGKTLSDVGRLFNRDHTTVINAKKQVEDLRLTDPGFRSLFDRFLYYIQSKSLI